jgi:hypothetical protein
MDEKGWLAGVDPEPMIDFLHGRASDRKMRLLAAAITRRVWHLLEDGRSRRAVEVVEDDRVEEWREAKAGAHAAAGEWNLRLRGCEARQRATIRTRAMAASAAASVLQGAGVWGVLTPAEKAARDAAYFAAVAIKFTARTSGGAGRPSAKRERAEQCVLLREVVGNPHRPVALDPLWRTPTVARLAEGIYADRAFDRMAYLGDALEEAVCTEPAILAHCRSDAGHVRGCWVVDLLLGRV